MRRTKPLAVAVSVVGVLVLACATPRIVWETPAPQIHTTGGSPSASPSATRASTSAPRPQPTVSGLGLLDQPPDEILSLMVEQFNMWDCGGSDIRDQFGFRTTRFFCSDEGAVIGVGTDEEGRLVEIEIGCESEGYSDFPEARRQAGLMMRQVLPKPLLVTLPSLMARIADLRELEETCEMLRCEGDAVWLEVYGYDTGGYRANFNFRFGFCLD